jgi:HSP20 family protein
MKERMFVDINQILDDIFDAARKFGDEFQKNFDHGPEGFKEGFKKNFDHGPEGFRRPGPFGDQEWDQNVDYYPAYSYPPMNVYLTADRNIVFEFALAGFEEKNIVLQFQGDYMIFSAKMDVENIPDEGARYFKRRLKLKDIDRQKYYVPADKFDQEKVKAVFKNGVLKVTVPPKEEMETPEGIKIEIVKEGE